MLAYNEFCNSLPDLRASKERRPELRIALASVIEKITLNPHGNKGQWVYEITLRGGQSPVTVIANLKPEGWLA
jgi:hypothetical protein